MDKFYKLTIQDNDMKCYNFKPFYKTTLDNLTEIRNNPITAQMRNNANIRFNNILNTSFVSDFKCCDNKNPVSNPTQHKVYNDFVLQYPKFRLIKNSNNEIVKIQLSVDNNTTGTGWNSMSPYAFCKINNAVNNNSLIKPSLDNPNKIFEVNNLLVDCAEEACSSTSKSLKNLFNDTVDNVSTGTENLHYDNYIETLFQNKDDKSLVAALIKINNPNHRLSSNDDANRLIHLSAINYDKRIMEIILALKPNLDLKNRNGDTALHLAIKHGNIFAVQKLLDAGASKNIKNKKGYTPIMVALLNNTDDKLHNNFYLLRLLHNNGGDIFSIDKDGNTLIHLAIIHKIKNIIVVVNYLIQNGIELNLKNIDGKTPLMLLDEIIENELVLTEQKTALLSVQNTIFYSIIKQNPDKYNEYVKLSDLPEGGKTLFNYQEYRCFNPDNIDDITGNEEKEDCIKKGGLYKKVNTSTKVKLSFLQDNEIEDKDLYKPKMENRLQPERPIHPLIAAINAEAKESSDMIKTTTENDFAGEYMSRDLKVLKPEYDDEKEEDKEENNTTIPTDLLGLSVSKEDFTDMNNNIIEGFNNSAKFIKNENIKKYLLFLLQIILLLLFVYVAYKNLI